MKKIRLVFLTVISVVSMSLLSCGNGSDDSSYYDTDKDHQSSSEKAKGQFEVLVNALNSGDIARIEQAADSLAIENERLTSDDRTVDETVILLVAYLKVHEDAAAKKNTEKDMATICKFIDVYNEGSSLYGETLNKAFDGNKRVKGSYRLEELVTLFNTTLNDYGSGDVGGIATSVEQETQVEETVDKPAETPSLPTVVETPEVEQPEVDPSMFE